MLTVVFMLQILELATGVTIIGSAECIHLDQW